MINTVGESKSVTTSTAGVTEIAADMTSRRQYRLVAKGAGLWFHIAAAGDTTLTAGGDNCHYLPQNGSVEVAAIGKRVRVTVIREGATDVTAILSEVTNVVG